MRGKTFLSRNKGHNKKLDAINIVDHLHTRFEIQKCRCSIKIKKENDKKEITTRACQQYVYSKLEKRIVAFTR